MSDHPPASRASEHEEAAALIPWYVNETLGVADRDKLGRHLLTCAACREDLALERHVRERMSVDGPLEFMPATSLNRLRGMLDGESRDRATDPVAVRRARVSRHWQWMAAASFAGALAAAGLLMAGQWLPRAGSGNAPIFRTVTDSAARPHEEVVRAVFAPTITLVELQSLLDEAQLSIISGPTEAGVYSLAARSNLSVTTSLALLRRHPTVRFAESTAPPSAAPAADDSTQP